MSNGCCECQLDLEQNLHFLGGSDSSTGVEHVRLFDEKNIGLNKGNFQLLGLD